MEDDLKLFLLEDDLNFILLINFEFSFTILINVREQSFWLEFIFFKWLLEDDLNIFWLADDLNLKKIIFRSAWLNLLLFIIRCLKKLNFGRLPQNLLVGRWSQFILNKFWAQLDFKYYCVKAMFFLFFYSGIRDLNIFFLKTI